MMEIAEPFLSRFCESKRKQEKHWYSSCALNPNVSSSKWDNQCWSSVVSNSPTVLHGQCSRFTWQELKVDRGFSIWHPLILGESGQTREFQGSEFASQGQSPNQGKYGFWLSVGASRVREHATSEYVFFFHEYGSIYRRRILGPRHTSFHVVR